MPKQKDYKIEIITIRMVYLRKKKIRGHNYYYLVEGKVIKGKVKQKVLYYVGNAETLLKRLKELDMLIKNR